MDAPVEDWFATCGELAITAAGTGKTLLVEAEHNDGGASILHLGLTLYGRRRVRSLCGEGLPDIVVPCRPGSLYLGGFTGPTHQVPLAPETKYRL